LLGGADVGVGGVGDLGGNVGHVCRKLLVGWLVGLVGLWWWWFLS
jgi:hypothetical protein